MRIDGMNHGEKPLKTYRDVVKHFADNWFACLKDEDDWYGENPKNLTAAIERAAMSIVRGTKPDGNHKKHSHQRRISPEILKRAAEHLVNQEQTIATFTDFDSLLNHIENILNEIKGIGSLTHYDIAARIALYQKLSPENVYLHAGTRTGARHVLGLEYRRCRCVKIDRFPEEFHDLGSFRIETVMCVYKDALGLISNGESATPPKSPCFEIGQWMFGC
jgi:hypothetical protein